MVVGPFPLEISIFTGPVLRPYCTKKVVTGRSPSGLGKVDRMVSPDSRKGGQWRASLNV